MGDSFKVNSIFFVGSGEGFVEADELLLEMDIFLQAFLEVFGDANRFFLCFFQFVFSFNKDFASAVNCGGILG